MDEISDIVKKIFRDISSKTVEEQKKLKEVFEKVLETNKLGKAKISGLKDHHLYVEVDSSARLYQMSTMKQKILGELKKELPDLEKISFKIGKVD